MKEYVLATMIVHEIDREGFVPAIDLVVRIAERSMAVGQKNYHVTEWPDFDRFLTGLVHTGEIVEVTYALPSNSTLRRAKSLYFPAKTDVWLTRGA